MFVLANNLQLEQTFIMYLKNLNWKNNFEWSYIVK